MSLRALGASVSPSLPWPARKVPGLRVQVFTGTVFCGASGVQLHERLMRYYVHYSSERYGRSLQPPTSDVNSSYVRSPFIVAFGRAGPGTTL